MKATISFIKANWLLVLIAIFSCVAMINSIQAKNYSERAYGYAVDASYNSEKAADYAAEAADKADDASDYASEASTYARKAAENAEEAIDAANNKIKPEADSNLKNSLNGFVSTLIIF